MKWVVIGGCPLHKLEKKMAKRAKDKNGKFIADDPSTPDVNEAYVDGKSPKKKKAKKKTATLGRRNRG
tara:strand:- start:6234 stop:6437 length:204 start_codon:yes stop_codon:yes gene_type:complete